MTLIAKYSLCSVTAQWLKAAHNQRPIMYRYDTLSHKPLFRRLTLWTIALLWSLLHRSSEYFHVRIFSMILCEPSSLRPVYISVADVSCSILPYLGLLGSLSC